MTFLRLRVCRWRAGTCRVEPVGDRDNLLVRPFRHLPPGGGVLDPEHRLRDLAAAGGGACASAGADLRPDGGVRGAGGSFNPGGPPTNTTYTWNFKVAGPRPAAAGSIKVKGYAGEKLASTQQNSPAGPTPPVPPTSVAQGQAAYVAMITAVVNTALDQTPCPARRACRPGRTPGELGAKSHSPNASRRADARFGRMGRHNAQWAELGSGCDRELRCVLGQTHQGAGEARSGLTLT